MLDLVVILLRGPPEGVDRRCSAQGHSERSYPAMKISAQGGRGP
jgi:hypothetical protein